MPSRSPNCGRRQVIAEVNDMYVKVAKGKGELPWHAHEHEDEMFLLLRGEFTLEFEEDSVTLRAGEIFVVPRGKRHRPSAKEECLLMLNESVSIGVMAVLPNSNQVCDEPQSQEG